jgi:hypothetical protein
VTDKIKNIQLKFSCIENWEAMPPTEGGRFCNKCRKKVYDFTASKAAEFQKILAENNYKICGRFTPQQLVPTAVAISGWKKWLSATLVLIGINLFDNKAQAQAKSQATDSTKTKASNYTFGGVDPIPQYPGGEEKLKQFIAEHLDKTKTSAKGRVNVTFVVEADGSVSNAKSIGRISDQNAADEAVRVIKLLPKWIPGKLNNNKPVPVQYTVPIIFD